MPPIKGVMFFNPSSGARLPEGELTALREEAFGAGLEVIEVTRHLDVSREVRERLRNGIRNFVAAGGDGTVNHVMQALVHTEATLAVIPVGTYNHFAKDLGIPLEWRDALQVATTGTKEQIDVGRVNDRFFVNNVSMGIYPELVERREERGRDYPRWKARLYAVYTTMRKYPHVAVAVETEHHQEVVRTQVFMVSNNSYDLSRVGIAAPREGMREGRLSVYWLPHLSRWALTKFAAHYLAGRVKEVQGFRSLRTARLKVHSSRRWLRVGIDGEVMLVEPPLVVTTVPASLLVRVPR